MNKLSLFLAAVSMLWLLSACGGQPQADASISIPEAAASQPAVPSATPQPVQSSGPLEPGNILIAYFSLWDNAPWKQEGVDTSTSASVVVDENGASGTTRYVAQMIQNTVGGDIHAILTAEPYSADFDAVVAENHGESSRAISSTVESMEQYDVVFIGYPVWATTLPQSEAQDAIAQWLERVGLNAEDKSAQGETAIRITVGETQLEGLLYDSDMARQFMAQLPQTITMTNYGDREVYGGIEQTITVEGEGRLRFDDGDITYCPANNTAAIFYSQSDRPNLTMTVYPIGKVTSDLSIFPDLPSRVEITFEVIPK